MQVAHIGKIVYTFVEVKTKLQNFYIINFSLLHTLYYTPVYYYYLLLRDKRFSAVGEFEFRRYIHILSVQNAYYIYIQHRALKLNARIYKVK